MFGPTSMGDNWGCVGTRGYMCQRYMRSTEYGNRSEVYSLGVVLLELITGKVQEGAEIDLFNTFIEDELPPLRQALDQRLASANDPWPEHVADEICGIAQDCLLRHRDRIDMQTAMRRLNRLAADFAVLTPADQRFQDMEQELVCLRLRETVRREATIATNPQAYQTCQICMDDFDLAGGLECLGTGPRHFLCDTCLTTFVASLTGAEQRDIFERHNHINCPVPDCSMHAPGHDAFPASAIGGHVSSAVFSAHIMNLARMERWRLEGVTEPIIEGVNQALDQQDQDLADQVAQMNILRQMVEDAAASDAAAAAASDAATAAAIDATERAAIARRARQAEYAEEANVAAAAANCAAETVRRARLLAREAEEVRTLAPQGGSTLLDQARNDVSRPCPGIVQRTGAPCRTPIERIIGCDHMTCTQCGHEFCYICLVPSRSTACPGVGMPHTPIL